MQVFEKLGVFYLGKVFDLQRQAKTDEYLLYDAKDLVTHAVCVGMTGSGKTGLCLGLLEEAAIDGVPALIIDPKGDLGNLLLTFPDLRPDDFRPWVSEDEAQRRALSLDQFAAEQAEAWRQGLSDWGQDGARIARLRDAADFAIYTPGSSSGLPLSILRSFAAPDARSGMDGDLLRERIATTTSGLLGLLGIDPDPLRSREHILVSNILEQSWLSGKDVDLPLLIQLIQSPPLQRVGVFDLESFYPASERFKFAMTLNNLLAAPGFGAWMEGESLEVGRLLYSERGKPRHSIFSIAHLSDAERMFFVTLLLNQVLGWMRSQPGTGSLRAILYMDEVSGFLPPVAEPPSKRALLTLLKQARAFGLGVVLATQNPVDLDYKALSNAGTWFIGRLQTERDKERLLEGLTSAAAGAGAGLDIQGVSDILSRLGKRVFLLHNVHEERPVVFNTRWTLSYLRGPLTRTQIKQLTDRRRETTAAAPMGAAAPVTPPPIPAVSQVRSSTRPQLAPDVPQFFVPLEPGAVPTGAFVYHPCVFGAGKVHVIDNRLGVTYTQTLMHARELQEEMVGVLWDEAQAIPFTPEQLGRQPGIEAEYLSVPTRLLQGSQLAALERSYRDFLSRSCQLTLWKSNVFKILSQPGESERDFRIRLAQLTRERRDLEIDLLRRRYAGRFQTLQKQETDALVRVQRQQEELGQQKMQTAISVGSTLLGAFLGRSRGGLGTLGRATTAVRSASRISREKQDIERAQSQLEDVRRRRADLEEQLRREADQLAQAYDPNLEQLQELSVRPKKTDILVQVVGLLWVPAPSR